MYVSSLFVIILRRLRVNKYHNDRIIIAYVNWACRNYYSLQTI